jgi:hypothetical protein
LPLASETARRELTLPRCEHTGCAAAAWAENYFNLVVTFIQGEFVIRASGSAVSPEYPTNTNGACYAFSTYGNCQMRIGGFEDYQVVSQPGTYGIIARANINAGSGMDSESDHSSALSCAGTIEPFNLTVSNQELSFGASGGSQPISISANVHWKLVDIENLPEWVKIDTRQGRGNGEVVVTADPLPGNAHRRVHYLRLVESRGYKGESWSPPILRIVQSK